ALTEADSYELDAMFDFNIANGINVERPTPDESRLLAPGLSPDTHGTLFFQHDAWVDNTALTQAIVRAAQNAGVVFERATVDGVERGSGSRGPTGVRWAGQVQWADWVVVAAGCWSGRISGMPPLPVEPARGQALAVAGQPVQRVVMSPRGYLVPRGDDQTLLGATVEEVGFDQSNTLDGVREVSAAGLEIAPVLRQCEFLGAWAGLRPATPDKLPFIGPFKGWENLIAATGHFRNGILLAPITAEMVRGIVTGQAPPIDFRPFSPDRVIKGRN
ncbi:MAG: FAD-dependent oxidoreductase, partial [Chloroflexota bacterium]